MKKIFAILFWLQGFTLAGCTQNQAVKTGNGSEKIGGGCEGCEAIYESPVPFDKLNHIDTLPDFSDAGPKLEISGIVYHRDGKTPAKDVIIYVYHTDQKGVYPVKGNETGWGKRHGTIRGWMKTDKNGYYKFYTLRPAAYPSRRDPAHIHITVKEPGKNEYWIDEYLFEDDPLVTNDYRNRQQNRGGKGIVKPVPGANGIAQATRNIFLGVNIPGYPLTSALPGMRNSMGMEKQYAEKK